MKKYAIFTVIFFIFGCEEEYLSEQDFLIQCCEAQGLKPRLLEIYDIESGEVFFEVRCEEVK